MAAEKPEISKQMQRRINERWEELRPELTILSRRYTHEGANLLHHWQETHSYRVAMLLRAGVTLRKIRQYNIDHPRTEHTAFIARLNKAVLDQRCRRRHAPPAGLAKFITSDHTTQGENK